MFRRIADNRDQGSLAVEFRRKIALFQSLLTRQDRPIRILDVVFSNSVIEHVGVSEDQRQMAREVQRVGNRYFVQTPNKYFPLEPHSLFSFFRFVALKIRVWLLQYFKLGWFEKTPNEVTAREIVESIRLMDKREFFSIFPTAAIYEEKILGITESFVAYGGWDER
jgi:hypothetical protein